MRLIYFKAARDAQHNISIMLDLEHEHGCEGFYASECAYYEAIVSWCVARMNK